MVPSQVFALLFVLAFAAQHGVAQDTNVLFRLRNSCSFSVWAAWITDPGVANPVSSGTEISPAGIASLFFARDWAGRIWGRTNCSWRPSPGSSKNRFVCDTGDCGSGDISCSKRGDTPATVAQFKLPNRYSVSLLEGYNLAMTIQPTNSSCPSAGCKSGRDLNAMCPKELAVVEGRRVIACKSPCLGLKEDQYCCKGEYACPKKCNANVYSKVFKSLCPKATTYRCDAVDYSCSSPSEVFVTFCP